ncbi:MAG: tetratricopeptide repeat protein [Gammaproteobacteria bacterium]|nr:tetratricopeptide repeat protein [Gammaproteobacteria bacterium]MCP5137132.1 tetratricopeptide repeat protein [Gammaproteobacteria bacterium]
MVEPRTPEQEQSGPLPGDPGYRHERVEIGSAIKLKPATPVEPEPASASGPRELPPVALVTPEPIRQPKAKPTVAPPPEESVSAEPTPDSPPAVAALLADANRQMRAGNNDAAAAALERALRVQPRDAYLWHRLAYVRLEQGRGSDAESLALKSNSLAGDKLELVETNNRLIERARSLSRSASGGR